MTRIDLPGQASLPSLEDARPAPSGIWPAQRLRQGVAEGEILGETAIEEGQIQPASLDLRLGDRAYRLPASFLPGRYRKVQEKLDLLTEERIDLIGGAVLEKGQVYLVPLLESLRLRRRLSAVANPKSSTGRLDVFCRVITDYGAAFDEIEEGYKGPLWLEIAPRSFNVRARTGSRLAQLRIKQGSPPSSDSFARRLNEAVQVVGAQDEPADVRGGAIALSVDMRGEESGGIVGYRARATDAPVDIDAKGAYDAAEFWEQIERPGEAGLRLAPDTFHILATKELVAVPSDHAGDMIAYDTLVGEFRVHYAGFFDPGFGYKGDERMGCKIVLELRSHEVPFMMEHGQIVGRVSVERLTEPTEAPYGSAIGSSYHAQGLTLGKQFRGDAG